MILLDPIRFINRNMLTEILNLLWMLCVLENAIKYMVFQNSSKMRDFRVLNIMKNIKIHSENLNKHSKETTENSQTNVTQ